MKINELKQLIKEIISENITLDIMKNPEKAPYLGSRFGQDVEAKGTYVLEGKPFGNWLSGKAVLRNPLYINVTDETLVKYKYELSAKYKAKGERLTKKLMDNGYDAIITVHPSGDYGEIVLFPNANFMLS